MRPLVVLLILVGIAGRARAQSDFFTSNPGDLSTSHSTLDGASQCNACHVNGTRAIDRDKCLGCHDHKDLASRIAANKGFHAAPIVKGKSCESCHDEHRGRSFDLRGWDKMRGGEQGFDHKQTGWPLQGKHGTTPCADCHRTKNKQGLRTYLLATDRLCGAAGCHKDDQPHKLERPELLRCERCHTESVWLPEKKPMDFDHNDRRDAAMPTVDSHANVPCKRCHVKAVFNLPASNPASCVNCHKNEHAGHLFGTKPCEWCHSPTFRDFKQKTAKDIKFFEHDERTRFDLGAHEKLECYKCHTKDRGEQKPNGACEQCHQKDNRHGDRFKQFGSPPRCSTCHPTSGWRTQRFDHSSTGFTLTSKHAVITCRDCHRGKGPSDFEKFSFKYTECMSCHQHAKVHADADHPGGRFTNKQCLACHQPGNPNIGKNPRIVNEFHGPQSRFPLVKAHKDVPCAGCHKSRTKTNKATFESESPECGDRCHQDTLHLGTLGKQCMPCHASGTWDALRFDHQAAQYPDGTKGFALIGFHAKAACESCHGKDREFKGTARTCSAAGCHANDDAHRGRLGDKCERCHVETGDIKFNHNTQSAFRIDGKHKDVRCTDCHPSITYKPRPSTCFGCHPEPAVHKGQYGTGCEQCHTTAGWGDVKPLHDVGDFSLKGAHDQIACERCHRDNRPLQGSGNLCINCHRQDDIHGNSLSPRCGECHTQWSFAPARFDHSRVGCNLVGLHRTLSCFDCHKNGNFSGVSPQCSSCHRDDALRAGNAGNVPHPTRTSCSECHNANSWKPADTTGTRAFGRESVCR